MAITSPAQGRCETRAGHLKDVCCVAPLGAACAAVGGSEGIEIVPWDGTRPSRSSGFKITALVSLGSQSLMAGDEAGIVRVWHYRRRILKLVFTTEAHTAQVTCLCNAGDVVFTASRDGCVRQLNVIENFSAGDFCSSESPVLAVATRSTRGILLGCEDGTVLEVHRRNANVLRRFELGAPVVAVDSDTEGSLVLAAAGGQVKIWNVPRDRPKASGAEASVVGVWSVADVASALLLADGIFVAAGSLGLTWNAGSQGHVTGIETLNSELAAVAMARGAGCSKSVLALRKARLKSQEASLCEHSFPEALPAAADGRTSRNSTAERRSRSGMTSGSTPNSTAAGPASLPLSPHRPATAEAAAAAWMEGICSPKQIEPDAGEEFAEEELAEGIAEDDFKEKKERRRKNRASTTHAQSCKQFDDPTVASNARRAAAALPVPASRTSGFVSHLG